MKDEWLRAAIIDDTVVADLLLRLKESPTSSSSSFILKPLPPSWGLRQRRSKPPSSSSSADKKRETRRSPTTPLSWTCAASPSEGCDESLSFHTNHLHPQPFDRFRSKISASTETPATTTSKRPRRKKTFAELKEEENSLMKERTYLKKELASLRVTLKQERSINENLKRIKLDLKVESRIKSEANSVDERNNTNNGISEAASSSVSRQNKIEDASEPDSLSQKCATSHDSLFMLPDLNVVPDEDAVVGMS
ncbi:uncharacterized protein LOC110733643 [Chenopodium quinoa]|uniref:uncharacterized protein LOC110733643 n=1 Tax=Chenopodium quinoa TaxID=63459 RepID=UPI000B798902|nr:uncharacterized protein LOC110733643 [Chenopodium quinoa]